MDHVWVILKYGPSYEYVGSLEWVCRTKKLAEDRKKLLLSKVERSERDFIGYEIEKWFINEGPNLFDKRKEE